MIDFKEQAYGYETLIEAVIRVKHEENRNKGDVIVQVEFISSQLNTDSDVSDLTEQVIRQLNDLKKLRIKCPTEKKNE